MVSIIFQFHPYLRKWSGLTNIFQVGWNHQLDPFSGDMIGFLWVYFTYAMFVYRFSRSAFEKRPHFPPARMLGTNPMITTDHLMFQLDYTRLLSINIITMKDPVFTTKVLDVPWRTVTKTLEATPASTFWGWKSFAQVTLQWVPWFCRMPPWHLGALGVSEVSLFNTWWFVGPRPHHPKIEDYTPGSSNIAGWKMDPDWRCISYWTWGYCMFTRVYHFNSLWLPEIIWPTLWLQICSPSFTFLKLGKPP